MAKLDIEKHSLKKQIEECEREMMGPKRYGEKILKDFRNEMNQILLK